MKFFTCAFFFIHIFFSLFSPIAFAYNQQHVDIFAQTKICQACDFNQFNANPTALGQSQFSEAILSGSYFYGSHLEDLDLTGLQAREINAVGLSFHNTDLSHADFSYSDISRLKVTRWSRGDQVNFTGAFLSGSDFSFTEFQAPDFFEAYMKNACLYKIIWPKANLSHAVLQSADLTYAKLPYANLEGANLSGATLSHADLSYANLIHAKITAEQLKTVSSLCNAILPDGGLGGCKPLM